MFKDVSHVIRDKWYKGRQEVDESKAENLVRTVARLVRAQIQEMECDMVNYPSCDKIVWQLVHRCIQPTW
jgi:hypothetical protein